MPFCHQCGAQVQGSDLFCSKCGEQQRQEGRKAPQPEPIQVEDGGEKVVDLQYRGVGIRFVATIFDSVICLIIFGLVGSMVASMVGGTTPDGFEVQGAPAVLVQVVTALLSILYFSIFEARWNGQTIGKKIVGIQVLNEDGSAVSFRTSFLRNILRIIDGFGFYLVAAISVWTSPRKQRVGDRIAHTCVVKKRRVQNDDHAKSNKYRFTSKDDVYISDID